MRGTTTAIRYARALFEVAREQGVQSAIQEDMQAIEHIFAGAPEIREFCLQSRHSPKGPGELVELVFCPYVHEPTQRTLRAAAENGRLGIIPHLPAALERIREEEANIGRVVLETVQPADADLRRQVAEHMHRRLGKEIELENRLNPALLGGFRILWRDLLLDNSVSGRLNAMKRCLTAHV